MAQGQFKGVFSTTRQGTIGTGTTRRKSEWKQLWCVWEDGDGFLAQALDPNLAPAGERRTLAAAEFQSEFKPEPDFTLDQETGLVRRVWSKERLDTDDESAVAGKGDAAALDAPDVSGVVDFLDDLEEEAEEPGEEFFQLDEVVDTGRDATRASAETKAEKAASGREQPVRLDVDDAPHDLERIARTDFVLALGHLKRGNRRKAVEMFEKLAGMKADFERRHKHLFNEFGIGLRRNRVYPTAIKHYERALELSPDDENLRHNIARAYYEQGDLARAVFNLRKSLEINPNLEVSKLFLDYIKRKQKEGGKKTK